MKLTVLADNRSLDPSLETEHGLCIYLDTGRIKVLLDTGASDVFLRNAAVMGIDLADVDYIFISHGHGDHAGGLEHILDHNDKAKVIVSSEAMKGSFHSSRRGMHDITPEWPYHMMENRLITVDAPIEVSGMNIIPDITCHHPLPKADGCLYRRNPSGSYVLDDFKHEMALQIDGLLFTGCAHNGLMNILESSVSAVSTVIGGFHLLDSVKDEDFESDSDIRAIASDLLVKYPQIVFYTGHCTGDNTFRSMKSVLGDNLIQFSCGMSMDI